ncbi:MAG: hypothetical protein HWQ43_26555 [Nostoc sp. JL31]|uniref:hypothetical protein n=1 Tax=Nostoc sp. JL31 TaxID=2815395 RepID=UPI00345A4C8C|nr:hypothetical protein [Nostoc sp. JL31]
MQPRQGIVEIFSTFVQFDVDQFSGWATDAKLRRSMKVCLESSTEKSDPFGHFTGIEFGRLNLVLWHLHYTSTANIIYSDRMKHCMRAITP